MIRDPYVVICFVMKLLIFKTTFSKTVIHLLIYIQPTIFKMTPYSLYLFVY